jgi:hypothetical protein
VSYKQQSIGYERQRISNQTFNAEEINSVSAAAIKHPAARG